MLVKFRNVLRGHQISIECGNFWYTSSKSHQKYFAIDDLIHDHLIFLKRFFTILTHIKITGTLRFLKTKIQKIHSNYQNTKPKTCTHLNSSEFEFSSFFLFLKTHTSAAGARPEQIISIAGKCRRKYSFVHFSIFFD